MTEKPDGVERKVESFPQTARVRPVSDELAKLLELLREAFPEAVNISFEFDGSLKVHIDLRNRDKLTIVQERLPYLGGGNLFSTPRLGSTPNHPFHHRISALVSR